MDSKGLAGAFGLNVLIGDTKAFIDGANSLILDELEIEATRSGWTVSLTAGFGIAAGQKGIAVGGSVGVNITRYKVEALLQNTNPIIVNGAVKLNAEDDTNLIAIAGAGGFGSKAGIGIAFAVSCTDNTVRAQLLNVYSLKYTAGLQVLATSDGLIVSVTASLGIATGSKWEQGGGYAGAGAFFPCRLERWDTTRRRWVVLRETRRNDFSSRTPVPPMRLLLDTCTFLWATTREEALSKAVDKPDLARRFNRTITDG